MTSASLHALLTGSIDYAGLFPPAALPMLEVATNYDHYRRSNDRWALGRIVVPVARLHELSDVASALCLRPDGLWRVSALTGNNAEHDAAAIVAWNAKEAGRFVIDAVEGRAASAQQIEQFARAFSNAVAVYVEIPAADDPDELIAEIHRAGVRAKIRMGGVTRDAFPSAPHVARFLARCAHHGVPMKATAGLHHPLHAEYPLTYAADAPRGTMFGFLNVFIAAALARTGLDEDEITQVLEERDASAFRFSGHAVHWRAWSVCSRA